MSLFARTFAITSSAWFLFALDRLAVTTALPVIRTDLGAGLAGTEWTVNAYTLSFAVLLLAGAALGDRFGRRRMFVIGLAVFTVGSAAAALAPNVGALVAARAVQGVGGAIFTPLSMTMLSAASPAARRGAVLGAWGGIGGLGVAAGPLLGGALTSFAGWQWIFWLNVPLGLLLVPLAWRHLQESHGPHGRLDLRGVVLSGAGVSGVAWAVIRAGGDGWARPDVWAVLAFGVLTLVLFVVWQMRAPAPMLPMRFFRHRAFTAANLTALLMYAALFGALFLVTQLLQTGLSASPLQAGLRMLPMVVMPMLLTPMAGALSDRWGTRPLMALGVALVAAGLAWLAAVTAPAVAYSALVPGLIMLGTGSALFFAPAAATVLGAVAPREQGQASGAATAVREIAVVLGIAVLASVFAAHGDLGSPARLVAGVVPALWLGAALAGAGVLAALALPRANGVPLVRVAGPGDHAAIRKVLSAAYSQYAGDISPEVWDAYRADLLDLDRHACHGQLLVAEVKGKIAGYAAFYPDATVQNLGWPGGWAGGRGMGVHPDFRGQGVADALMAALEHRARESGAPVFAFHTSGFMTAALALYVRLGYHRAPEFDRDMNAHYGLDACRPWAALAYLKYLPAATGGTR
ncbi:DHA2 family efflux MFS transporter permease subunit [Amycolatopsis sp. H6(2020)]|nr:DHA2 family efflux MFS transporter permease subunit [Amycolatopsis sp. H6(2020)]